MKLHAVKLVMENGIIEDCKEAIVITKVDDGMSMEAVNLLPVEQMLLITITFYEMFNEYLSGEDAPAAFGLTSEVIRHLISDLLKVKDQPTQPKGEILQ